MKVRTNLKFSHNEKRAFSREWWIPFFTIGFIRLVQKFAREFLELPFFYTKELLLLQFQQKQCGRGEQQNWKSRLIGSVGDLGSCRVACVAVERKLISHNRF